jgi:uncharacterized damage-inducible protein DinB
MDSTEMTIPEPWLRGTLTEIPPVQRAVLHALELAQEDLERWCGSLTDEEVNARPGSVAPVAFHIRHIARSLDRLLTYAEGKSVTPEQLESAGSELEPRASREALFRELHEALYSAAARLTRFSERDFSQPRSVGRRRLSTTLGGLLVHIADHTQRHAGQAITTARIVRQRP